MDLEFIMEPTTDFLINAGTGEVSLQTENNNNNKIVFSHLTDHDYVVTTQVPEKPKPRSKKLKKHLKITELRAIYNCTTCGYRTMNRENLRQHICITTVDFIYKEDSMKLPNNFIQCPKCNYCTKNMANLRIHLGTHIEGVRQRCTDCDVSKNCVDTVYKCPKCSYSTKNPTSLKVHMHIHSRGTPYKCTECNYSAKDLKELIRHYDDMKDLRCKCGYTTHVKQQMISHKRTHNGDKPFSCGVCKYATCDRSGLQKHMKKHNQV